MEKEPNPYEPPRTPKPLKPSQIAKRGIGLGAIGCLTPIALFVALFINCHIAVGARGWAFVTLIDMLPLPIITLVGMAWWAIATHRRNARDRSNSQ
jgi:hypothetical protein